MTIGNDDNWLQRRYFTWAERHYRRMPPGTRAEVERIDRWLYSWHGAGLWLSLAVALVASIFGLEAAGLPLLPAIGASLGTWIVISFAMLGAWLQPERFAGRKAVPAGVAMSLLVYLGAALGFLAGRIVKEGGLGAATLGPAVRSAVVDSAPLLALAVLLLGVAMELVAFARRRVLRAELERTRLVGERDAAARLAAEARLRLLQGQIRPHFIFNTLASLQHWVDTGDARAGPLLRSLTALLRSTTETMDAPLARIGEECEAARHYLAIVGARFGARLEYRIDVAGDCNSVELPAGLVLTLVENAVEHGIEPALAGGTIEVVARREHGDVVLRVRDDGVGVGKAASRGDAIGRGVGLANSRERLAHRYGNEATLQLLPGPGGRGTEARMRIALAVAAHSPPMPGSTP
jgi:signal transduction histidine kinase